ncbi:MAG: trigger factor, partial [Verrucomicrobiota bacterium]
MKSECTTQAEHFQPKGCSSSIDFLFARHNFFLSYVFPLMNISLEDVSACRKRIKIEVPVKTVDEELVRVTTEFQKAARIKGFRPGKAPRAMIEKMYSNEINEELKRTLVPKAFRQAVQSKELKIVSEPQVEDLNFQRGVSMSFSTIVDLQPEFKLPDYKGIKVKKGDAEISDQDVEELKKNILDQHAEFKDIEDRELQSGDFAVIDYTGTVDDKPVSEFVQSPATLSENKNFWLWIKDDHFLPNFPQQLVGMNIGESRTITIDFPEDYYHETLQKKKGSYQVTLNSIKLKELPELTDEIAQKVAECDAEELMKRIHQNLQSQKANTIRNAQNKEIIEFLNKSTKFELPESVVKKETERMMYDIVQENQARGISDDMLEEKKKDIFEAAQVSAKDEVKVSFILDKISDEEKINVDTNEIMMEIQMMSQMYKMPANELIEKI